MHNKNSISLSLLDPNRLCDYFNRLKTDGNTVQLLCDLALDKNFPDVDDLDNFPKVRRLFKIPEDETGLVVFYLARKIQHHPKFAKHGGDLALVQRDVLQDMALMGMSDDGQWAGVQIYKNYGCNPDEPYPIVLCHKAFDGVYKQVKDLVSSIQYTKITIVDEKPTAAVGSRQDERNKKGLTSAKLSYKGKQITLVYSCSVEEANELYVKAKAIVTNATKECKANGSPAPTVEDFKYVFEQLQLRRVRNPSTKPAGFRNLDAFGLEHLESTTDVNNSMALETMASSGSEGCNKWLPPSLSSDQMEMIQSLHSAEAAIAAGKMNADEVFPNDAAISNAVMASADPDNYAEV